MTQYIDWPGISGKTYRYFPFNDPTNAAGIKSEAGNYVFVKETAPGYFVPLYFGVADDLSARVPNYERWKDAIKAGMTQVFAHIQSDANARLVEERDLIQKWNPTLNVQHRTTG